MGESQNPFFGDGYVSNTAIGIILWAVYTNGTEPQLSRLYSLPIEIQDDILSSARTSSVASAKLGRELGLGLFFPWTDAGEVI